jgi:hypothetical protein
MGRWEVGLADWRSWAKWKEHINSGRPIWAPNIRVTRWWCQLIPSQLMENTQKISKHPKIPTIFSPAFPLFHFTFINYHFFLLILQHFVVRLNFTIPWCSRPRPLEEVCRSFSSLCWFISPVDSWSSTSPVRGGLINRRLIVCRTGRNRPDCG